MEPKQLGMLILLLAVAMIGSGYLIYTLQRLDKEDDTQDGEDPHGPGH